MLPLLRVIDSAELLVRVSGFYEGVIEFEVLAHSGITSRRSSILESGMQEVGSRTSIQMFSHGGFHDQYLLSKVIISKNHRHTRRSSCLRASKVVSVRRPITTRDPPK